MTKAATRITPDRTIADLLARLGDIPPDRVRMSPTPGTATEKDLLAVLDRENRGCELVDGVLVEKTMGLRESVLAMELGGFFRDFLRVNDLGIVTGEQGTMRILTGLVRIPDVAFISWARLGGQIPKEPIPDLVPDLAVEVLSEGNTRKEMARKLREYFKAGVRLVWYADPTSRTVRVHTSARRSTLLDDSGVLDGGDVLPGFRLAVRDWFDRVDRRGPPG